MKKFLSNLILFSVPLLLFILVLLLLPPTPRAKTSLIFAKNHKDSLLLNTASPRIIFVGGSNLSFGLNSHLIKDSLELEPINTAIHAGIGLKYMLDSTLPHIKQSDVVVVIPEYDNYFGDFSFGRNELLRTIMDVSKSDISLLNLRQIANLVPFLPQYILSKLKVVEYTNIQVDQIYGVQSFNRYGDASAHWQLAGKTVKPIHGFKNSPNRYAVQQLQAFNAQIKQKGAMLFVSFPSLQHASFETSKTSIAEINLLLKTSGLNILGNPERYAMADSLIFDTPYHLNYSGVIARTTRLIEDLRSAPLLTID